MPSLFALTSTWIEDWLVGLPARLPARVPVCLPAYLPMACSVMNNVIMQQTRGPCILDGEMIVWNKKK